MSTQSDYIQLCRTLAQDRARDLTDAQLAIALAHHEHIWFEVAAEQAGNFHAALNGTSEWLCHFRSVPEFIGYVLVAAAKRRAMQAMKLDIEIAADDLEQEARVDNEHEVHV